MSNQKLGSKFEKEFCDELAKHGFWVHRMAQNSAGQQPADVIAVYEGIAYLIDCKLCSDDYFHFSRMEENQRLAMKKWIDLKGTPPVFALKDSKDRVWMLDYEWAVLAEDSGMKGIHCEKGHSWLKTLDEWVYSECD